MIALIPAKPTRRPTTAKNKASVRAVKPRRRKLPGKAGAASAAVGDTLKITRRAGPQTLQEDLAQAETNQHATDADRYNARTPSRRSNRAVCRMPDFTPIVEQMKSRYRVRVKRWRRNMSGCAWRTDYESGRSINWIEAPVPRTPISLAIFLHEVGHHVIGFERYKRRCEEEYHVWLWAIEKMRELGVEPDERVTRRFDLSMRYAVGKAVRRGVKNLPESLQQFAPARAA